ncbi:MAG TPA: polysaccharide deacetylase family protein [Bacteroidales bacterium]|nr:polysaccharide deacetylase family protein [Bacteroidales bacterium]
MESKTQIFCFHRISDENSPAYPPIPIRVFDKILSYINRHYFVIPLEEVFQKHNTTKTRLIITFDDAYYDFYENALPLLNKYKFRATQHIITQSAATGESFWTQRLNKMTEACFHKKLRLEIPELAIDKMLANEKDVEKTALDVYLRLLGNTSRDEILNNLQTRMGDEVTYTRMMGWRELNECAKSGVTMGSHTHNHATLTNLNNTNLNFELEHSRNLIRQQIPSSECLSLAFPNGKYNDQVVTAAKDAGYHYLLSAEQTNFVGNSTSSVLPRYCIYNKEWWKNYIKLVLIKQKN